MKGDIRDTILGYWSTITAINNITLTHLEMNSAIPSAQACEHYNGIHDSLSVTAHRPSLEHPLHYEGVTHLKKPEERHGLR